MSQILNNRLALAILLMLGIFAAALFGYGTIEPGEAAKHSALETGHDHSAHKTVNIEATYVIDPTNERKLVGLADNVFVGRVVRQVGDEPLQSSHPDYPVPQGQYAVVVEQNIEGLLGGTVVVNQTGGYDPVAQEDVLFENDPLLKAGEVAVFMTTQDEGMGVFHQIVAQPYGHVTVATEAERVAVVAKLTQAVAEQIPFDPNNPADPPNDDPYDQPAQ